MFFTFQISRVTLKVKYVRSLFRIKEVKQSRQDDFAKELLGEAAKQGSIKTLGQVVGLPDKEDWQNICNMIDAYRKGSVKRYGFDILVDCIATARQDYREQGRDYSHGKYNVVNRDSSMRYHFEFPDSFIAFIERGYPLMFKDRDHYHWFCRNFKQLMIADRF